MKEALGHIVILLGAATAAGVLYASIAPDRPQDQAASDPTVTAVVILPQRAAAATITPQRPAPSVSPHEGHASLAKQIQTELMRVGCYDGEANGLWTTTTRLAMQLFIERVNARLPIDKPDQTHLALIQAHQGKMCSAAPSRTPASPAADTPTIATIAPKLVSPPTEAVRPKEPPRIEGAPRLISPPAAAVRPKEPAKADPVPAARKADAPPPPIPVRMREVPAKGDPADPPQSSAPEPGPTPPVGIYEGRPKRSWRSVQSRQLAYARSVVRNLKRAVKTALPLP